MGLAIVRLKYSMNARIRALRSSIEQKLERRSNFRAKMPNQSSI